MEIKFAKDLVAVEQNNYATEIVNAYIVYKLDTSLKIILNNFKLKNCLFGATNTVKSSDKEKWVYSGYGLAFLRAGSCSFHKDKARNVVIFNVDNSSSSHADNLKNNFVVQGEGQNYGINGSSGSPEKKFSINFSKVKTKFYLSLQYNHNNVC